MKRKVISGTMWFLFVVFGWMTLTVPMISAGAPAVLMIACGVVAWFTWPHKGKEA